MKRTVRALASTAPKLDPHPNLGLKVGRAKAVKQRKSKENTDANTGRFGVIVVGGRRSPTRVGTVCEDDSERGDAGHLLRRAQPTCHHGGDPMKAITVEPKQPGSARLEDVAEPEPEGSVLVKPSRSAFAAPMSKS